MSPDNPRWQYVGDPALRGFTRQVSIHEPFDPDEEPQEPFDYTPPGAAGDHIAYRRVGVGVGVLQLPIIAIAWLARWFIKLLRVFAFGTEPRLDRTTRERDATSSVAQDLRTELSRTIVDPVLMTSYRSAICGYAGYEGYDVAAQRRSADALTYFESVIRHVVRKAHSKPKILWVDDHPRTREASMLENVGCIVRTVTSTEAALETIAREKHAIVITDMERDKNPTAGLDLLRRLREAESDVQTIVYTSSRSVSHYGDEARKIGATLCTAGLLTLLEGIYQLLARPDEIQD